MCVYSSFGSFSMQTFRLTCLSLNLKFLANLNSWSLFNQWIQPQQQQPTSCPLQPFMPEIKFDQIWSSNTSARLCKTASLCPSKDFWLHKLSTRSRRTLNSFSVMKQSHVQLRLFNYYYWAITSHYLSVQSVPVESKNKILQALIGTLINQTNYWS